MRGSFEKIFGLGEENYEEAKGQRGKGKEAKRVKGSALAVSFRSAGRDKIFHDFESKEKGKGE